MNNWTLWLVAGGLWCAAASDLQDRIVFIDDDEVKTEPPSPPAPPSPPPPAINSSCVLAGGVGGRCVKMVDCRSALKALVRGDKLQICSDHPVNPVVCCSKPRWEEDSATRPPRDRCAEQRAELQRLSTGDKATYKCMEYHQRLLHPCEGPERNLCTRPGDDELIVGGGGEDAERYQFRHMALLLYGPKPVTPPDVFCGGSVLSERFVLTAAHCASSVAKGPLSTVVTGILRISDPRALWRRNSVRRFVPHPDFDSPNKYHDIALLETNEPIRLDSIVVPACLGVDATLPPRVSAAGWGALGDGLGYPDALQNIPLFRANSCSAVYGPQRLLKRGFDDASQLCYGDDGTIRDTCQGDSGGPVQVEAGRCLHVVLGVTSFGRRCTTLGQPAVYTRVAHYARWIVATVWPD